MRSDSRIFVAGHRGLAGSAIVRALRARGFENLILRTRGELDLTDAVATERFFADSRPEYVFLAAARVGGIAANAAAPADFIRDNLAIQLNVIDAARRHGVAKLLFLGSSCIYPKFAPQPMKEEHLLTGILEPTNEAYAIAKIAGIKMCAAYNRQYGCNFICAQPTNLYGPNDNYDLESSHVMAALIRKIEHAHSLGSPEVEVWGTGAPRREFLHSDDMAEACVHLMRNVDAGQVGELVNLGTGEDISIRDLARTIAAVVGFGGSLRFDPSRPDGTPRKLLDISRIRALGWSPRIALEDGIRMALEDFRARLGTAEPQPKTGVMA